MKRTSEYILRAMVSLIFAWSGGAKLMAPPEFAAAVAGYRLTGPVATLAVAAVLPWIEVLCAAGLWVPRWRRAAERCLIACCVLFVAALGQAWVRGLDIECGCFGLGERNAYVVWLVRDFVILAGLVRLSCATREAERGGERPNWRGPWLRAGALLGCGVIVGLTNDALRSSGNFWREILSRQRAVEEPPTAAPSEVVGTLSVVELQTVRDRIDSGSGILVDARPRVFWRIGHLPGAISVPHDDFDRGLADLRSRLDAAPGTPVVVYCEGGECRDGEAVARRLISHGIEGVRLFRGGWEAWESAGLPIQKGQ